MHTSKRILFAPLDWGLGHASRCIPLIEECLLNGHEVIIAANQMISILLQKEFPTLRYLPLHGYNVTYSKKKWMLPIDILAQIPKIRTAIRTEHQWLQQAIEEYQLDLVISDNRYGLYTAKIPCVFITHQLQIQVPQSSFLQKIINRLNHRYISKFTTCLVPDYEVDKMSGYLSTATGLTNITYIGNLSRFTQTKQPPPVYDLLVLLSGPEPQRSLLENLLLDQIQHTNLKTYVVRGKPGSLDKPIGSTNSTIVNHLSSSELQTVIASSAIVICRSGYSTIMDLIKLNRHAILIPTPGQTEQEYLASYLADKNWFMTCNQEDISLKSLVDKYTNHTFSRFPTWALEQYKIELRKILA